MSEEVIRTGGTKEQKPFPPMRVVRERAGRQLRAFMNTSGKPTMPSNPINREPDSVGFGVSHRVVNGVHIWNREKDNDVIDEAFSDDEKDTLV